MSTTKVWKANAPREKLTLASVELGPLQADEVEIDVAYCGLCHSDLSIVNNEWGLTQYPVVPGHEAVGKIVAMGAEVKGLHIGQIVGVGWNAESCMHCHSCMTGEHQLCQSLTPTIVGHDGGFAERIRSHWAWAIPLPDSLDLASAGPLLCAGATVFAPLLNFDTKPTDHVGIVGIGGLGHLALKFAHAWGCEVTAFTSTEAKAVEAREFGAHNVVNSRNTDSILEVANTLDLLLITVNTKMDWSALVKTLRANGRMAIVGAVLDPLEISAIDLIFGQKRVAGSLNASPAVTASMLEFAARHNISPKIEKFPMSQVNEAMQHLVEGKARYRVVLESDFR